jgi:chemotaxis response regulator CheB
VGLARLRARGGLTWVQEPASAVVPVMPRAALALAPHAVLDPGDMGRLLATWSSCHDRKAQR